MAISIRTNYGSLDAQRNLTSNQAELDSSMRKLASGYRITRAADDAAGLAVSEKMRAAVSGTNQAVRNANDGISMIQTAEGGLSEVSNIVLRVRELAVQAANGTLTSSDHAAIGQEISQIRSEVDSIGARTKFNGTSLLNADTTIKLQVGSDKDQTMEVSFADFTNASGSSIESFGNISGSFVTMALNTNNSFTAATMASKAQDLIAMADKAIGALNNKRAELGAAQNRLGYTINVQQVSADNLSAANSRIRDVDVASESAKLTRSNILAQAGVSVLAQANQMPQLALKLIG